VQAARKRDFVNSVNIGLENRNTMGQVAKELTRSEVKYTYNANKFLKRVQFTKLALV
jgi:hypothetical protein